MDTSRDDSHNIPYEMQPKNKSVIGTNQYSNISMPHHQNLYGIPVIANVSNGNPIVKLNSQNLREIDASEDSKQRESPNRNIPLYLQKLKVVSFQRI